MLMERLKRIILIAVIGIMAVLVAGCSSKESDHTVTIEGSGGEISILRGKKLEVSDGMALSAWDRIEVGKGSYLKLLGDSNKHISFGESASFVLRSIGNDEGKNILIDLSYGEAVCTIDDENALSGIDIKTPNASLSLRGSAFSAAYNADNKTTIVEVSGGKVCVSYDKEIAFLEIGEGAEIKTVEGKTEFEKYIVSDSGEEKEGGGNITVKPSESIVTTVPPVYEDEAETSTEGEAQTVPEDGGSPVVTGTPAATTGPKTTTKKPATTTKKPSETTASVSKSNSIKMQEVASGRIVYVNIPSGYKLWEYDAADYKNEGKLYGASLVPTKKGKYNISISFGNGDPMNTLVKKNKTDYDGDSYKVIDEYKCTINSSKTGTAYIAELNGSKEYLIFIECVSGEDVYLVIEQEDSDGNTSPVKLSNLNSSTKDIKKFVREMFPAAG